MIYSKVNYTHTILNGCIVNFLLKKVVDEVENNIVQQPCNKFRRNIQFSKMTQLFPYIA